MTAAERSARNASVAGRAPCGLPGPPVLVVGATTDDHRAGLAFLTTSGHYGVHGCPWPTTISGPERRMTAVLSAVHRGLSRLYDTGTAHDTPLVIRLDNLSAVVLLRDWAMGCTGLPEEYEPALAAAGLEPLRQTVIRNAAALTFCHQPPRTETALNHAANALATLGLHCVRGTLAREVLVGAARRQAAKGLAAYGRQSAEVTR